MRQLEIEKTCIQLFKTNMIKVGLVFSISDIFINKIHQANNWSTRKIPSCKNSALLYPLIFRPSDGSNTHKLTLQLCSCYFSQKLPGKLGQQSSICWNSLGLFRDNGLNVFQDGKLKFSASVFKKEFCEISQNFNSIRQRIEKMEKKIV